jgi:hypothetical protein
MESFFSLLLHNVLDRQRWASRAQQRLAIVTRGLNHHTPPRVNRSRGSPRRWITPTPVARFGQRPAESAVLTRAPVVQGQSSTAAATGGSAAGSPPTGGSAWPGSRCRWASTGPVPAATCWCLDLRSIVEVISRRHCDPYMPTPDPDPRTTSSWRDQFTNPVTLSILAR